MTAQPSNPFGDIAGQIGSEIIGTGIGYATGNPAIGAAAGWATGAIYDWWNTPSAPNTQTGNAQTPTMQTMSPPPLSNQTRPGQPTMQTISPPPLSQGIQHNHGACSCSGKPNPPTCQEKARQMMQETLTKCQNAAKCKEFGCCPKSTSKTPKKKTTKKKTTKKKTNKKKATKKRKANKPKGIMATCFR